MRIGQDSAAASVWDGSPQDVLDGLPPLLAACSIDALWTLSQAHRTAYADRMDRRLEAELDEMGPLGEIVRREMRPGLWGRLLEWWDRARYRFAFGRALKADAGTSRVLEFDVPLIQTHPPDAVALEHDAIEDETRRLREEIGALISADRGFSPSAIHLPDDALDFAEAFDDVTDEQELLLEMATITAYWPPTEGKPALALSQLQEDGGFPIQISLLAHSAEGDVRFREVLQRASGKLL